MRFKPLVRGLLAAVLSGSALILLFVPLAPGSASSLFGCAFGRDLLTRHDQGGNVRFDNGRGPDCTLGDLILKRVAIVAVMAASGASMVRIGRSAVRA